jgi:uncharacterized OB-fold protein
MPAQHPQGDPGDPLGQAVEGLSSASFDAFLREGKLVGTRCRSCGTLHVPPRPICPACHGEEMAWAELSGRGRLVAFTAIHVAPTAMIEAGYGRDNPYCAGIVELDEGPKISAQILGVDATQPQGIAIGTPLRIVFAELPIESSAEQERDGKQQIRLAFKPYKPYLS